MLAGAVQVGGISVSLQHRSMTLRKVTVTTPEHLGHHVVFRAEAVILRLSFATLWQGVPQCRTLIIVNHLFELCLTKPGKGCFQRHAVLLLTSCLGCSFPCYGDVCLSGTTSGAHPLQKPCVSV